MLGVRSFFFSDEAHALEKPGAIRRRPASIVFLISTSDIRFDPDKSALFGLGFRPVSNQKRCWLYGETGIGLNPNLYQLRCNGRWSMDLCDHNSHADHSFISPSIACLMRSGTGAKSTGNVFGLI